jgi:hypothetical protein
MLEGGPPSQPVLARATELGSKMVARCSPLVPGRGDGCGRDQSKEQDMTAVDYIFAAQRAWEAHDRAHRTGNRELIKATLREWAIAAEQRRLYGG